MMQSATLFVADKRKTPSVIGGMNGGCSFKVKRKCKGRVNGNTNNAKMRRVANDEFKFLNPLEVPQVESREIECYHHFERQFPHHGRKLSELLTKLENAHALDGSAFF